jgi:hypothetical protein
MRWDKAHIGIEPATGKAVTPLLPAPRLVSDVSPLAQWRIGAAAWRHMLLLAATPLAATWPKSAIGAIDVAQSGSSYDPADCTRPRGPSFRSSNRQIFNSLGTPQGQERCNDDI